MDQVDQEKASHQEHCMPKDEIRGTAARVSEDKDTGSTGDRKQGIHGQNNDHCPNDPVTSKIFSNCCQFAFKLYVRMLQLPDRFLELRAPVFIVFKQGKTGTGRGQLNCLSFFSLVISSPYCFRHRSCFHNVFGRLCECFVDF